MTEPPAAHPEPPPGNAASAGIPMPPPAETPARRKRSGSMKRQRAGMAYVRLDPGELAELERRAAAAG